MDNVQSDFKNNNLTSIMLDIMPMCSGCWNRDFQPIACNESAVKLYGLKSRQEYLDRFYDLSPQYQPNGRLSAELAREKMQIAFAEGYARFEWIHQALDGEPIPAEITLVRAVYDNEPIIAGYARDLRDSLAATARLREAEERMRIMLDATPLSCNLWDRDLNNIDCNQAAIDLFDFSSKDEYRRRFMELMPRYQPNGRLSADLAHEYIREAFENGFCRFEWLHRKPDGELMPTDVTLVRVELDGRKIVAGYTRDLRKMKIMAAQMRKADERTQVMLDATPLCCCLIDRQGVFMDCNSETTKLFELETKEEFLYRFNELCPQFQPCGRRSDELAREYIDRAFETGYLCFEWTYRKLDGAVLPTEVVLVRVKYNNDDIVAGYIRDLTELKASIAKMREADERTQIMLDATPLCCSLVDRNGKVIDCNQEAANLFDLNSKQEYIDHFRELEDKYQPDGSPSHELGLVYVEQAYRHGYCRFEWVHRKLNGEPIPAEITMVRVKYRGQDIVAGYTRDLREMKHTLAEMHKVEDDLRLARDAAEESTRAKSEFLANMSHEIRTPMNGILGLVHLTLNTKLTEKQRDYLEKTEKSARALLRIINDILDFSKIEAGKLDMEACEFRLNDLINELYGSFEQEIKAKGLYFSVDCPKDLPEVLIGDPLRLRQILLNVTSNAIKFTQRGGISIQITRLRQNTKHCFLKFAVHDTGIGMTAEQRQSLFRAFSQGDASITRRYGGTGLGLAICKNLIRLMHGAVWVDSEYGRGSTFYFTLRLDIPSPKTYRQEDEAHNVRPILTTNVADALPLVQELPNCGGNAHLLLAEDNEINQIIAQELLEAAGYTIDIAANGKEALDMLAEGNYALVLMDIQMPVMDGLSAARIIRSQPEYADLPVIAMSAHAMTGDREKSLEAGMNDHLTKPIDPKTLNMTLQKWLQ